MASGCRVHACAVFGELDGAGESCVVDDFRGRGCNQCCDGMHACGAGTRRNGDIQTSVLCAISVGEWGIRRGPPSWSKLMVGDGNGQWHGGVDGDGEVVCLFVSVAKRNTGARGC